MAQDPNLNDYGAYGEAPPQYTPPTASRGSSSQGQQKSAQTMAQEAYNASAAEVDSTRKALAAAMAPGGSDAFYAQEMARIKAADPTAIPLPTDLSKAYNEHIKTLRLQYDAATRDFRGIQNSLSPAAQAKAVQDFATRQAALDAARYENQQREQNNGMLLREANTQALAEAQQRVTNFRAHKELADTFTADDWARVTHEYKQAVNAVNIAENNLQRTDAQDRAALSSIDARWKTMQEGAVQQWGKEYEENVRQRGQDMNTATSIASQMGELAGKFLPFMMPKAQVDAFYAPGSPASRLGMVRPDSSGMEPAPSYAELMQTPMTSMAQMLGHTGLPPQVGAPPFMGPDAPPDPYSMLGASQNSDAMRQVQAQILGQNRIAPPPSRQGQYPAPPAGYVGVQGQPYIPLELPMPTFYPPEEQPGGGWNMSPEW